MHQTMYRGKIDYIGDTGSKRGQEWFTLTRHGDNSRTLRATCIIEDSKLFRDCVLSFDPNWYPLDAFVRLRVDNGFQGSGWFRFGQRFSKCESFTADGGRISQRLETETRAARPTWPTPWPATFYWPELLSATPSSTPKP